MQITTEDKHFLLKVARDIIYYYLIDEKFPKYYKSRDLYNQKIGVIIKIFSNDKIRGYGAVLYPEKDLIKTIQDLTLNICFHEPRFKPLEKEEIENLSIHMALIESIEDVEYENIKVIKPDSHGVYITFSTKKSLLLPWDIEELDLGHEEYVKETALKAGIKDVKNAKIKILKLITFSEKDY